MLANAKMILTQSVPQPNQEESGFGKQANSRPLSL
jgi:hypothetical protein